MTLKHCSWVQVLFFQWFLIDKNQSLENVKNIGVLKIIYYSDGSIDFDIVESF
jgi:uncharacterized phage-associated protein